MAIERINTEAQFFALNDTLAIQSAHTIARLPVAKNTKPRPADHAADPGRIQEYHELDRGPHWYHTKSRSSQFLRPNPPSLPRSCGLPENCQQVDIWANTETHISYGKCWLTAGCSLRSNEIEIAQTPRMRVHTDWSHLIFLYLGARFQNLGNSYSPRGDRCSTSPASRCSNAHLQFVNLSVLYRCEDLHTASIDIPENHICPIGCKCSDAKDDLGGNLQSLSCRELVFGQRRPPTLRRLKWLSLLVRPFARRAVCVDGRIASCAGGTPW